VSPGRCGRPAWTLLALALAASTTACGMPEPTGPRAPGGQSLPASSEATASANPTSGPSRAVAMPRPGAGPLELEVVEVDPALTTPLLDIASTGSSIIYSSGAAVGPTAAVAPDLFRITPGRDGAEVVWRNPVRDRTLMRIGGDDDVVAFVDGSSTGERSWIFWLIDGARDPIQLDRHPGDVEVSSAAPSFDIDQERIVWTSFDAGPNGTVSQLFVADGPGWEPRLLEERLASEGEFWLPSLLGDRLAYTEVTYHPGDETGEYHVVYRELSRPDVPPRRLDGDGHASNPLVLPKEVIWKQVERGYNMFNWGYLVSHSLDTGETTVLDIRPQDYINYPSAGTRFVGGFGWNLAVMTVYDTETGASRIVERHADAGRDGVDRANISGDLMAWVHITIDELGTDDTPVQLRYAWLPPSGRDSR
jgi:hypothetical protein